MSDESPKLDDALLNTLLSGRQIFAIGTMQQDEPRWFAEVQRDALYWANTLKRPIEITVFHNGQWYYADIAYPSDFAR